jgi:hypothetical protein
MGVVKIEEARQPEKAYAWNNPFEKRGKPHGVLILHGGFAVSGSARKMKGRDGSRSPTA